MKKSIIALLLLSLVINESELLFISSERLPLSDITLENITLETGLDWKIDLNTLRVADGRVFNCRMQRLVWGP